MVVGLTIELRVQGSPVRSLVELVEAAGGLGGEQDVLCVETCVAEPQGQVQDGG